MHQKPSYGMASPRSTVCFSKNPSHRPPCWRTCEKRWISRRPNRYGGWFATFFAMPCSAVGIAPAALHVRPMFPAYPFSHRLHDEVRLGHHVSPKYPWETLLVYAALYGRCRTSRHVDTGGLLYERTLPTAQ